MAKAILEFYMKRGLVNIEDVDEQDVLECLKAAIKLSSAGEHEKAVNALPQLFFEWIPSNGDGDTSEVFSSSEDFKFDLDANNSSVRTGVQNGNLLLTISVKFEMDLIKSMAEEELSDWLNDNSIYFCGYAGNGWLYHSDDGCNLSVLRIE